MPHFETRGRYQVGDEVRLVFGSRLAGRVTEVRRSSYPGVRFVYRMRVPMDPEPLWLEVREDEIEKTQRDPGEA